MAVTEVAPEPPLPRGRAHRAGRAGHHLRPDHRRPARRAHRRAAARLDRQRRAQLVHRVRSAVAALPRDRARPARPRARHPLAAALPPRRLRRRRRGAARPAGRRAGDRRRLLDGRTGRAAAVAPAPRAGGGAGAVRHVLPVRPRRPRAADLRHDDGHRGRHHPHRRAPQPGVHRVDAALGAAGRTPPGPPACAPGRRGRCAGTTRSS